MDILGALGQGIGQIPVIGPLASELLGIRQKPASGNAPDIEAWCKAMGGEVVDGGDGKKLCAFKADITQEHLDQLHNAEPINLGGGFMGYKPDQGSYVDSVLKNLDLP